jgi:mono/diheme cytochrome c family protein
LLGVSDPAEKELVGVLERVGAAEGPALARQVLLSLGEGRTPALDAVLLRVLEPRIDDAALRDAVLSGLGGRELDAVLHLAGLAAWSDERPERHGRPELLEALASCIVREGRSAAIERLLYLIPTRPPAQRWQAAAICRGVLAARPKGPDGAPTYVQLADEPAGYERLAAGGEPARAVADALAWPGKAGVELPFVRALTDDERARFDRGRALFGAACAQCHQASGLGEDGKAPALRWSRFVLGDATRLARVVRHGLVGPLEVDGALWNGEMPAWSSSDADLAALLTYVRREWGHGADPVTPADVAAALAPVADRLQPFTAPELGD